MTTENVRLAANGIELDAVLAGPADAPLVILLHGFPEFSYGWRHQIGPLADLFAKVRTIGDKSPLPDDKSKGASA